MHDDTMRDPLEHIRQALEEHLSTINENTAEIQALFDYLQQLEVKMEKLTQRLDAVQMVQGRAQERPHIASLTRDEKNIFLILYTEEIPLCYREIAARANLPLALIPDCISSLVNKGIPLLRSFAQDQMFFKLDPAFRDVQAKENIVHLSLQNFMV